MFQSTMSCEVPLDLFQCLLIDLFNCMLVLPGNRHKTLFILNNIHVNSLKDCKSVSTAVAITRFHQVRHFILFLPQDCRTIVLRTCYSSCLLKLPGQKSPHLSAGRCLPKATPAGLGHRHGSPPTAGAAHTLCQRLNPGPLEHSLS